MSTSLSKLKSQIARLQKQAAAIETGIVARIKADIAKHGLTAEQLFGGPSTVGTTQSAVEAKAAKSGAAKPPKFADGSGNVWGGMGKRPDWIRAALAEGKSLEDFLVAGKKAAVKSKPAAKVAPAKKVNAAKKGLLKKQAAAKKAAPAKAAAAPAAAKRPVKAAAKKSAAKKPARARAAAAVEPAQSPKADGETVL